MEYLTEAHVTLVRPHFQKIQSRITELKEAAAKYSSPSPDALLSPGRWAMEAIDMTSPSGCARRPVFSTLNHR